MQVLHYQKILQEYGKKIDSSDLSVFNSCNTYHTLCVYLQLCIDKIQKKCNLHMQTFKIQQLKLTTHTSLFTIVENGFKYHLSEC